MFCDELRRAVEAAPRVKLPELAALLWRAFGAGQVTEAEAEELSALIEARKAVQTAARPVQRHVGSRPRSAASMERRRTWAARGLCPPQIAARFTLGEAAVLAVVAAEVRRRGACSWAIGHIAAVAGVSETTVKRALREARRLGLVSIQVRRQSAWRNDTNVVTVVAPAWVAWLRLAASRGGGGHSLPGTKTQIQETPARTATKQRAFGREHKATRGAQRPVRRDSGGAGPVCPSEAREGASNRTEAV